VICTQWDFAKHGDDGGELLSCLDHWLSNRWGRLWRAWQLLGTEPRRQCMYVAVWVGSTLTAPRICSALDIAKRLTSWSAATASPTTIEVHARSDMGGPILSVARKFRHGCSNDLLWLSERCFRILTSTPGSPAHACGGSFAARMHPHFQAC